MKIAGLDFGIKKTTANAVASVYIFTYKFNDNKSVYKLENQIKLVINRINNRIGLDDPEIDIVYQRTDFCFQSTLVLKYTDIDKL